MGGEDINGDSPKLYVQKTSMYTFKCTWCQSKELSVDNIGRGALIQHAKTRKHKDIANVRTGRDPGQVVFNVTANDVINAETNNNEAENEEVETLEPAAGSSGGGKKGIMDFFYECREDFRNPSS